MMDGDLFSVSLCNLRVLCVSVVEKILSKTSTTEAQRTRRWHREIQIRPPPMTKDMDVESVVDYY
jgi:hypothetical protein